MIKVPAAKLKIGQNFKFPSRDLVYTVTGYVGSLSVLYKSKSGFKYRMSSDTIVLTSKYI